MPNDPPDQKTRMWLRGLELGLIIAEEISEETWRSGRIDVLERTGKVVLSAPLWKLAQLEGEAKARLTGESSTE